MPRTRMSQDSIPRNRNFTCSICSPIPAARGFTSAIWKGYTATDIIARYKRMKGFNVLHPMGWDAFGLPAEQFAIKTGLHPSVATARNIEPIQKPAEKNRIQLRLGAGSEHDRSRLLQMDSVDLSKAVQFLVRSQKKGSPADRRTPCCQKSGIPA